MPRGSMRGILPMNTAPSAPRQFAARRLHAVPRRPCTLRSGAKPARPFLACLRAAPFAATRESWLAVPRLPYARYGFSALARVNARGGRFYGPWAQNHDFRKTAAAPDPLPCPTQPGSLTQGAERGRPQESSHRAVWHHSQGYENSQQEENADLPFPLLAPQSGDKVEPLKSGGPDTCPSSCFR